MEKTYYIFGKEAILVFKINISHLINDRFIRYEIGEFTEVKDFMKLQKKYVDFKEITKKEYDILKKDLDRRKRKKT